MLEILEGICYNVCRQERCECSCGTQKPPEVTTPGVFYWVIAMEREWNQVGMLAGGDF